MTEPATETQVCTGPCGLEKHLVDFNLATARNTTYRRKVCRKCAQQYGRDYRKNRRAKETATVGIMSIKQAQEMGIIPPEERRKAARAKSKRKYDGGNESDIKAVEYAGDAVFDAMCKAHGLPPPEPEYIFAPWEGGKPECRHTTATFKCKCGATRRKWQFDYLFEGWLALEKEGGLYGKGAACPTCGRKPVGAHTSIERLVSDMEKYNEAAILGFTVIRCTPEDINSGAAFALVRRALQSSEEQP